jgi:Retron-type reverse transcriptase
MTRITIPKSSGGTRDLAVGAIEDRIVERALLGVLDPLVDPLLSPWSFAYRRGLGVKDAVRALAEARESGARWIVRTDFDECFDLIPRWPLLQRLAEVINDADLVGLVQRLVSRPVVGEQRSTGLGLHQGGGLSPTLANLYLDAFDRRMMTLGYQVIRYGDDIAIPVADRPCGNRNHRPHRRPSVPAVAGHHIRHHRGCPPSQQGGAGQSREGGRAARQRQLQAGTPDRVCGPGRSDLRVAASGR